MISYANIETVTVSNGGTFGRLKKTDNQKQYLALKINQSNQIENHFFKGELIGLELSLNLRNYEEQTPDPFDTKQNLFLFSEKQGILLSDRISKYFSEVVIQKYLTQLLYSLYLLHKRNILGRVISTSNILVDENDYITLLDFGFGPQIAVDGQLILAPPEFIKQNTYDIKIDSWLIGVFLYHLIKLTLLTKAVYPNNQQYLKEFANKQNILVKTDKLYEKQLLDFTEKLLVFDPALRLDFSQIYQHPYIQSLKIPNYTTYVKFYQQIDINKFIQLINIREQQNNLIDTAQLKAPSDIITPKSKMASQLCQVEQFFDYSNDSYVLLILNQFTSKYCEIWKCIQLEQFKCFLLKCTIDNLVQNQISNDENKNLIQYGLLKMSFLIRQDLLKNLQNQQKWQVQLWEEFTQDNKYYLLNSALKQAQKNELDLIKNLSQKISQIQSQNKYFVKPLNEFKKDRENQFNFNDESFSIFAFRNFTILFISLFPTNPMIETIKLHLLAAVCHILSRFTNYEKLQQNLSQIQGDFTLSQVYRFIQTSHENENKQNVVLQINKIISSFEKQNNQIN